MAALTTGLRRLAVTGLLLSVLLVFTAPGADARKPQRTSQGTTAEILIVTCGSGAPKDVRYTLSSSRSTVDVEVRWSVVRTDGPGVTFQFGSMYAATRYVDQPVGPVLTAKAPVLSDYRITGVTVMPIKNNGRLAGVSDYERITCS